MLKLRKTLEEKRQVVRETALLRRLSSPNANLTFMTIALEKGWDDVARSFLQDSVNERVLELVGA